jgi:hypothetical protein
LGVVTANAEWLKLAENKRGNSFYIETDSVQLDSDKRIVLELIDYKKPDRDGDRSVRVQREYDCTEKKYRVQTANYHKGAMGSGDVSVSTTGTLGWTDVDPQSPGGAILSHLCR